jgi:hypothetical protein
MSSKQLKLTDMIVTKSVPLKTVLQKTEQAPPPQSEFGALEAWFEPNHLVQAIVWPRGQSPS